ncbi:MAG TPA: carbohydrate porin [Alphaproteobacteria bacterium]|nr:carbohydrate porin [Alphaproteobacteria bacterium]
MRNTKFVKCGRGDICFASVLSGAALALLLVIPAFGTPPTIASTTVETTNQTATTAGFFTGITRRDTLLGDMWGLRPWLSKYGLSLSILETSEVLGNVSGGVNQGFEYDGLTQMILQLDTQKAFNWYGGTFNVSALQIHGRNLSQDNLYTLQTASGIEADRATRLWELWYDQAFDREGRFDLRVGQQSLDQEFMVSQNALLFVNTMFGWPMVPSADLPGGGPAYPLSAPGVRLQVRPINSLTFLAGVFNGSPLSNSGENSSGTTFPLDGGTLIIAELQYRYPSVGTMVYADQSQSLSGTYKIGFWYDTEDFADQEYDNTGLSLANPASTGVPRTHHGDYSLYAVMDQMVWRSADPNDADRALNFFARAMGTPQADRNLIDFSLNAGFTLSEPLPHRDDDTFGIGMGFTKVSDRAADLDKDYNFYNGVAYPVRSDEAFVEVTYQYQLTPWCQLQPDFQYVFNPGGGIPNPNSSSGERVKDEAVIGLRMNIAF